LPIAPRSATILGVQAAQTTTTGELPLTESHACASGLAHAYRRAQPHGFVRNRWYLAANRDARVEWDFEDRLVKVTKSDGTVVENTYDVDGVLVRTAVNGVGTDYLVDTSGGLSHVVAEVDGSGTVTALYVRAGDMLLEEVRGGVVKMYEADGLGSVRGLLDVSGARTDSYAYEAFGSTLSSTGSDANPYRFAGERLVDSVGMYQNRARWLDTRTGRFVSVDPAEGAERQPATFQPYLYGDADPVLLVDPSGRDFDLPSVMMTVGIIGISSAVVLLPGCTTKPVRTAVGGFLTPTATNRFELSLSARTNLQRAFDYEGTRYDLRRVRVIIEPANTRATFTLGDEIFMHSEHADPGKDPDDTKYVLLHEIAHCAQFDHLGIGPLKRRKGQETARYTKEGSYEISRFPGLGITPLELLDIVDGNYALEAIAERVKDIIWRDRASFGI